MVGVQSVLYTPRSRAVGIPRSWVLVAYRPHPFDYNMADVSDQGINQGQPSSSTCKLWYEFADPPAYLNVRSDKSDTNWLLLDYEVRLPSLLWLGLTRLPHTYSPIAQTSL